MSGRNQDAARSRTDAQGRYTVPDLPVGNYEAQASAQGLPNDRGGAAFTLTVGAQAVVDFSMMVGQSQQTITVEAQVSAVDTASTAVASYGEQKQINDLPLNGRNFTDLVTLIPGVAGDPRSATVGRTCSMASRTTSAFPDRGRKGRPIFSTVPIFRDSGPNGSGSGVMGTTLGIEAISEFFGSYQHLHAPNSAVTEPW